MDRSVAWMTVLILGVTGLACGDDGGGDQPSPMPTAPSAPTMDAGAPQAGTGAPLDMAGADAMTASMPMPVPCGTTTCQPPAGPLGALGGAAAGLGAAGGALPMPVACCLDAATGTCGLAMGAGAACEAPAVADPRCPSVDLGPLGAVAGNLGFGCCTDQDRCGVDGSAFGRGCVENEEAAVMLNEGGLGGFIMVPPPRACDAAGDGGIDDDGGR